MSEDVTILKAKLKAAENIINRMNQLRNCPNCGHASKVNDGEWVCKLRNTDCNPPINAMWIPKEPPCEVASDTGNVLDGDGIPTEKARLRREFIAVRKERDEALANSAALYRGMEIIANATTHKRAVTLAIHYAATVPCDSAERVKKLVDALEKLARLGNPGGGYGNSDGNVIAQDALREWKS